MENRLRESFHLLWLAAIVLCAALALFSLVFASCSKGGAAAEDPDGWRDLPASAPTDASASGEPAAVTFTPEPTPSPEPTPEPAEEPAEETPIPEPQG